jgi:hypothetical protein
MGAYLGHYGIDIYFHVSPLSVSPLSRRLGLLFCHFPAKDILRYTVLLHRVRMAGQSGLATTLSVDVDKVRPALSVLNLVVVVIPLIMNVGNGRQPYLFNFVF